MFHQTNDVNKDLELNWHTCWTYGIKRFLTQYGIRMFVIKLMHFTC